MDYNSMVEAIDDFLHRHGGKYADYYIGITNDIDRRLFGEHSVDRKKNSWIHCKAKSDEMARKVEQYFLKKGCAGGAGGGDEDSRYVYCYKITKTTVQ